MREHHGWTSGQIAAKMGISRNAVIGKCSRLKIEGNKDRHPRKSGLYGTVVSIKRSRVSNPLGNNGRRRKRWVEKPSYSPPFDIVPLRVSFTDLADHHCRFVLGDKGPDGLSMYCGHPKFAGASWCYDHHRLTHMVICEPVLIAAE